MSKFSHICYKFDTTKDTLNSVYKSLCGIFPFLSVSRFDTADIRNDGIISFDIRNLKMHESYSAYYGTEDFHNREGDPIFTDFNVFVKTAAQIAKMELPSNEVPSNELTATITTKENKPPLYPLSYNDIIKNKGVYVPDGDEGKYLVVFNSIQGTSPILLFVSKESGNVATPNSGHNWSGRKFRKFNGELTISFKS